ncbi:MAG: hypothetical protein HYW71_02275 [Candidatus Niyogibacteria bacterium]|nr:hypothetical protein [Candidatus Niyogibacteria bacterium]
MTKSHLPKSIRKHIAKEKARFRRDNLTREDYEKKVGELYKALEKKPPEKKLPEKKPKEKKEEKSTGEIVKKPVDKKKKAIGFDEIKKFKSKAADKKSAPKKDRNQPML